MQTNSFRPLLFSFAYLLRLILLIALIAGASSFGVNGLIEPVNFAIPADSHTYSAEAGPATSPVSNMPAPVGGSVAKVPAPAFAQSQTLAPAGVAEAGSTNPIPARSEKIPAGLYSAWVKQQQTEGGADYALSKVNSDESASIWQASNPAQGLKVTFDNRQVKINGWSISLNTPGEAIQPIAENNHIEYRHANGVNELYVNGSLGLEQVFTLTQPLDQTEGDGWLTLPVSFEGARLKEDNQNPNWLKLVGADGEYLGQYGKVYATDSLGQTLESVLLSSGDGQQALLRVKVAGASYPVEIDPLVQRAEITASDGTAVDDFGAPVALSSDGNTAFIGAPGKSIGANSDQGAAYIFTLGGGIWSQQAKITAPDGAANDFFGNSVSLSSDGNTALVGVSGKTIGANSGQGAAYVFTRSGTTWSQQIRLTSSDGASDDAFGTAVVLSSDGNTSLIGASCKNNCQGAAYVFTRSGSNWSQQARLIASNGAANDFFGGSVSLNSDGTTALVGAPCKTVGSNNCQGAVYVFGPSLTLSSSPNPSRLGQSVTFTATVIPSTATGTVTFTFDSGAHTTVVLASGIATYSTASLGVGNHTVTATYSGDSNNSGSSTTITQIVPIFVTSNTDDGTGTMSGTLSYALSQPSGTSGLTIAFDLTQGNIITFTGSLVTTAKLKAGVTLMGGEFGSANRFIINGNGLSGNGLHLAGKNTLVNLTIEGFIGKELVLDGTGNYFQGVIIKAT